MFTSYTFFILLSFVSVMNGKQFRCDYTYFAEIGGWLKYHKVPADWFEARLRCHLEGTDGNRYARLFTTSIYYRSQVGALSGSMRTTASFASLIYVIPMTNILIPITLHIMDDAQGGNLASPTNISMKNAMRIMMEGATDDKSLGVFTGIHAFFSRGDYSTIEGVPLWRIPHTWAKGEPNNYKNTESCIAYYSDGVIADVNCHGTLPYICYKQDTGEMDMSACGTTDFEYIYYDRTGSCYKFHTVPRTWSRAYMACAAEGGYLAIINSEEEADVIGEIFAAHPVQSMVGNFWQDVAFVGFCDWNEHGEWLTIHGETLLEAGYTQFGPTEPNNSSMGEFCGAVYRWARLNDLWCDRPVAFICEKSPDSLLCDTSTNNPE